MPPKSSFKEATQSGGNADSRRSPAVSSFRVCLSCRRTASYKVTPFLGWPHPVMSQARARRPRTSLQIGWGFVWLASQFVFSLLLNLVPSPFFSQVLTLHPKLHLHLMSPALAGRFPKNPDCYSCSQDLDYSPPGWSWGPLYWWQVEHSRPWHKAVVQLFTGNELKGCTSKRKGTNKRALCVCSLRSIQEVVALIWTCGYQEGKVEERDS